MIFIKKIVYGLIKRSRCLPHGVLCQYYCCWHVKTE